jgi:hypothetical protein
LTEGTVGRPLSRSLGKRLIEIPSSVFVFSISFLSISSSKAIPQAVYFYGGLVIQ